MIGHIINSFLSYFDLELKRQETINNLIAKGKYRWLQNYGINSIIDVGGNTGQFVLLISQIIPNAKNYSFEPLKECFQNLVLLKKKIHYLECFNFALGDESGICSIYRSEFSASSSLLPMMDLHKSAFPHTAVNTTQQISIRTLDDVFPLLSVTRKILLKIDVQGFELRVLRGASRSLATIDLIIIELSFKELYGGQPLFHEIYLFLISKGFCYRGNFDMINHPQTGECLQVDAIFERCY